MVIPGRLKCDTGVSSLSDPQRIAMNLLLLARIPVAFSYSSSMGQIAFASAKLLRNRRVSSANWDIRCEIPPISIPSSSSKSFIERVSASAITRNASGEKGHPYGTPLWMVNGSLREPLIFTRRVGGAAGLASSRSML